jgi:hypothetical protein
MKKEGFWPTVNKTRDLDRASQLMREALGDADLHTGDGLCRTQTRAARQILDTKSRSTTEEQRLGATRNEARPSEPHRRNESLDTDRAESASGDN